MHEKEQLQQRVMNQDAMSGIQNRQALDEHVGSLIHAPGIASQQPPGRSMNISNIRDRVISHSGHVIAGPRRETGIIPQAESAANPAARIPAVVSPLVIANGHRGQNQAIDDPFMAAILRIAEAGDRTHQSAAQPETSSTHPNNLVANKKVQQETRHIELQSLMLRHKFAQELPADYPNKATILAGLTEKIFGHTGDVCPICQEDFDSSATINTARLPCCTGHMHTSCLSKLLKYGSQPCPLCRKMLE